MRNIGKKTLYLINSSKKEDKTSDHLVKCIVNNSKNIYYNYGAMLFGPLLYSFCKWIHDYCIDNSIEKVLFIARDGYIVKKAWDLMYSDFRNTDYIYASRSSVLETRTIDDITIDGILDSITDKELIAIKGIVNALGIPMDKAEEICSEYERDINTLVNKVLIENNEDLYAIFSKLIDLVKYRFEERTRLFGEYIKQFVNGLDKVVIVDIGWRGTIQEGIERVIANYKNEVEIHGLYLGIYRKEQGRRNINISKGYLYDQEDDARLLHLKPFRGLAEFFFSAPHGKTASYQLRNNVVEPVLETNEYDSMFGNNSIEKKVLNEMHKGAIKYVMEMQAYGCELDRMDSVQPLYKYSTCPKGYDIQIMGDLHFCSDTMERIASPKTISYYLLNIKQVKEDFSRSVWKLGFMRRLFHNIPLPYISVYNILLKKYNVV